jgi:hypothetical protein
VKRLAKRDHIACVWASRGFFQALGVGDWQTLQQVLVGMIRHPDRIRDRLEMYGDFCARMLEMTLRDLEPEFIYLSEPISDNKGPLISPAMFEEFMTPAYRKIISVARAHGCENTLVSTYGSSARLLPAMIKAGVTILWVSEAGELPEMDYRNLRRKYGPDLGLVGGIPLSLLRAESPGHMRARLRDLVLPLLESGRYVPLAGGRVREEVPWSAYKCYRELLCEMLS